VGGTPGPLVWEGGNFLGRLPVGHWIGGPWSDCGSRSLVWAALLFLWGGIGWCCLVGYGRHSIAKE